MKRFTPTLVGVVAAAAIPLTAMLPAHAAGTSCNPTDQIIEEWNADKHRVKIKCSAIGRYKTVRGELPISGEGDSISPWFRTVNEYYYGVYKNAYSWQVGTPRTVISG